MLNHDLDPDTLAAATTPPLIVPSPRAARRRAGLPPSQFLRLLAPPLSPGTAAPTRGAAR